MMTGAKIGNDPWKSLAAEIINRARADCRGNIETSMGNDTIKGLIQYDAEHWLRANPWCQFLLDCCLPIECDVLQYSVAVIEKQHRRRNYMKCLPQDLDMNAQIPVSSLVQITSIRYLSDAVKTGRMQGTQQPNGKAYKWCSSLADVAHAIVVGELPIRK